MRRAACAAVAAFVVALAGCQTDTSPQPKRGPTGRTTTPRPTRKRPKLARTPDIHTPPSRGRWTLRLVSYVAAADADAGEGQPAAKPPAKVSPEEEERRTRLVAETTATALRKKDIPAFILTRSIAPSRLRAERLAVFYVCVGAFDSITTKAAKTARTYFRKMVVAVGREPKRLFAHAQFVLLRSDQGSDAENIRRFYDLPPEASWGLVVGLFQGPKHKELAQRYVLRLQAQGLNPKIQQSEVASRVVVGASEARDDPAFERLKERFPRAEHNLLGYIAFRGTIVAGGARLGHELRARATANDLRHRGYDAFSVRVRFRPPGSPRAREQVESRVFVVRKEGRNFSLDELRRTYRDVKPHAVRPVTSRSSVIDLRKGAWDPDVKRVKVKTGRRP